MRRSAREAASYWLILGAAFLVLATAFLVLRSRRGLALTAIRDNELAARSLGIDIWRTKFVVYVVVGGLTSLIGALIYFLAEGWARSGLGRARGGAALTKLLFLLSLAVAVALDFDRLFFLIMIIPIVLLFFLLFGTLGRVLTAAARHPALAALIQAVAFSWAIAATFPLFVG